MEEENTQPTEETKEEKPLSIVEEAKRIRDEISQMKDSLKEENDRKEKLQAESMLGGTSGGHVETKPKEETNEEYVARMQKNGWREDGEK